jgi:hypothetical protein
MFCKKAKIVNSHTADSKPIKQEINGTVILPPLVFPACCQALRAIEEIPQKFVIVW